MVGPGRSGAARLVQPGRMSPSARRFRQAESIRVCSSRGSATSDGPERAAAGSEERAAGSCIRCYWQIDYITADLMTPRGARRALEAWRPVAQSDSLGGEMLPTAAVPSVARSPAGRESVRFFRGSAV